MAERKLVHYAVKPKLFNDIVEVLEQIPGSTVRRICNRIENLGGTNECEPVFTIERPSRKKPTKRKAKKKAKRKVDKKRGGK